MTDEKLAALAQTGDRAATRELMCRYEHEVAGVATRFYLPGADHDDVLQEGRIGLLKAVRTFTPTRGVPFSAFAHLTINAELVTALRAATRFKHRLLTDATRHIHIDGETFDAHELASDPRTVDDLTETADLLGRITAAAKRLSPLERRALLAVVNGDLYAHDKSLDNAAVRARQKLRDAA